MLDKRASSKPRRDISFYCAYCGRGGHSAAECYHKAKEQFDLPKKLLDLRKAASYANIPLEKVQKALENTQVPPTLTTLLTNSADLDEEKSESIQDDKSAKASSSTTSVAAKGEVYTRTNPGQEVSRSGMYTGEYPEILNHCPYQRVGDFGGWH